MELEKDIQEIIPQEILKIIEEEVEKSVAPLREEDPWTAELDEECELDYKISQCLLLNWLKTNFSTEKVLYAGSGSDIFPKLVFGEDKVIHTSMEEYENDRVKYFPDLGTAIKSVADNVDLPFPKSCFDMVLFFGLFTNTTEKQLLEAVRVLNTNGLIVCDDNIASNIDLLEVLKELQMIEVPEYFQNRGISETSFAVFRKL